MTAKRGWSSADVQPPVLRAYPKVARPVFNGVGEMQRYEEAWRTTPRLAGETLAAQMDRVVAKAQGQERQPGEDGE